MKPTNKIWNVVKLSAFTLPLSLFIACSQDDHLQDIADPNAVKINATIGNMTQTRLAYSDTNTEKGVASFENGDQIRVKNLKRDTKGKALFTYDGTNWNTTDAILWNGGTEANNEFQAWYPEYAGFDGFTIKQYQNTLESLGEADWMTASAGPMTKPEDGILRLNFEHRLSKVTIKNITYGTELTGSEAIGEVIIYAESNNELNITSMEVSPYITPQNATIGSSPTITAIITPGKYQTEFMKITVGNKEMDVYPNSWMRSTGLEAGKHYEFSLKVGKDKVSITGVSVQEWGTTSALTSGIAGEAAYLYDATTETYTAYTGNGLEELLTTGGNVKLGRDIELESGGGSIKNTLNLDLNSHTLTAWLAAVENGSLNVSNGTLQYTNGGALGNSLSKIENGTCTVSAKDCTLTGTDNAFVHGAGSSTLENCTLNGYLLLEGYGTVTLKGTITWGAGTNGESYKGIKVTGEGSVICHFDPTANVAEGGTVTKNNDNTWTVTKKATE